MSGYKFNGYDLDTLLTGHTNDTVPVTNFKSNSSDITYRFRKPVGNLIIRNSTLLYKYGSSSVDIASVFLPLYSEFTATGTCNIPTWCTKLKCILIGGGGWWIRESQKRRWWW